MSTTLTDAGVTPLMKQYWDLKAKVGDALLLFRMGDFYELFADDAVEAARLLEITLTSRDRNKPNPTPMAGVPHHSVQSYIQRLLKAGKKVAIGEQMEDPATVTGKAIVRRDITRIFTPGIQFDARRSGSKFLGNTRLSIRPRKSGSWAASMLATGEALVSDLLTAASLAQEIAGLSLPIRHLVTLESVELPEELSNWISSLQASEASRALVERLPSNSISLPQAQAASQEALWS